MRKIKTLWTTAMLEQESTIHGASTLEGTKLRLDVYPIAATKISVGTTSENIVEGSSNEKYDDTKVNTRGKYSGLFWSVGSFVPISKSLGGYVSYESQKMENGSVSTKEMLDWSYNLYGDGDGDERQTMFGALFYKLNQDYTLAAIFDSTKMKESGSKSTTMAAGVSSGFKNVRLGLFLLSICRNVFSRQRNNGLYRSKLDR